MRIDSDEHVCAFTHIDIFTDLLYPSLSTYMYIYIHMHERMYVFMYTTASTAWWGLNWYIYIYMFVSCPHIWQYLEYGPHCISTACLPKNIQKYTKISEKYPNISKIYPRYARPRAWPVPGRAGGHLVFCIHLGYLRHILDIFRYISGILFGRTGAQFV